MRADVLGNLTRNAGATQTYSTTAPHQLTTAGGTTTHHTARGQMDVGPGFSATYTDFDLPRTMTSSASGLTASFRYDAGGERVVKDEPGTEARPGVRTTYIHGVFERRQEGAAATDTLNVSVGGRVVAQITTGPNGARSTSYVHSDGLGSPTAISDEAGRVTERYRYGVFGSRTRVTSRGVPVLGDPPPERDGFTSHGVDPELGAINMNGRMYLPSTGRFMTPDPLVQLHNRQAWNPYSYVLNNPMTLTDPSGFGWFDDVINGDLSAADALGYVVGGLIGLVTEAIIDSSRSGSGPTATGARTGPSTAAPVEQRAATTVPVAFDSSGASSTRRGSDAGARARVSATEDSHREEPHGAWQAIYAISDVVTYGVWRADSVGDFVLRLNAAGTPLEAGMQSLADISDPGAAVARYQAQAARRDAYLAGDLTDQLHLDSYWYAGGAVLGMLASGHLIGGRAAAGVGTELRAGGRGGGVVLEHGTTRTRALSIERTGPDPNFMEPGAQLPAETFSAARPSGPFPYGSPAAYALAKAGLFPGEGGPAILRVVVPQAIVDQALSLPGEVRFGPQMGLEALMSAWPDLERSVRLVQ